MYSSGDDELQLTGNGVAQRFGQLSSEDDEDYDSVYTTTTSSTFSTTAQKRNENAPLVSSQITPASEAGVVNRRRGRRFVSDPFSHTNDMRGKRSGRNDIAEMFDHHSESETQYYKHGNANVNAPFLANATSIAEDDPWKQRDNTRDVTLKRILFRNYPFKHFIFLEAFLEVPLFVSFVIVSGIIVPNSLAEINTCYYLIIGTILTGIILIFVHLPLSVMYWWKRKQYRLTHQHLVYTTLPLLYGIPLMIFGWFSLGSWTSSYVDTCGNFNDNQPTDPVLDPEQYNNFIWAHGSLAIACVVTLAFYWFSIYAHRHPEVIVRVEDHFLHRLELEEAGRDVDDDEDVPDKDSGGADGAQAVERENVYE